MSSTLYFILVVLAIAAGTYAAFLVLKNKEEVEKIDSDNAELAKDYSDPAVTFPTGPRPDETPMAAVAVKKPRKKAVRKKRAKKVAAPVTPAQ